MPVDTAEPAPGARRVPHPERTNMSDLCIYASPAGALAEAPVEMAERKGIGHPDTICDGVVEAVAEALAAAYELRFGRVLPHQCDKALLCAGTVEPRFGGGRILQPMKLILGDRATPGLNDARLDLPAVATATARAWVRRNLRHLDPESDLKIAIEMQHGCTRLADLVEAAAPGRSLPANDTVVAVGYAPLSETERLVLETECYLNSPGFKDRFPQTGEDVKVMGIRRGRLLDLTVACR